MVTSLEQKREDYGSYPHQSKNHYAESSVSVPVSELFQIANSCFVHCFVRQPARNEKADDKEELCGRKDVLNSVWFLHSILVVQRYERDRRGFIATESTRELGILFRRPDI